MSANTEEKIAQTLQSANGRILGYLIRVCGDFSEAEDLCQDVMISALSHWREEGLPETPIAWLFTTAKNRATDRFRQRSKQASILNSLTADDVESGDHLEKALEDDLLRLIFTCCHPALGQEVRVPLTLKSVTGLSMEEVARAFLTPVRTMEQRLVRAKRKITAAGIAYEVPTGNQLEPRLDSVMQTLYLLFNEGYSATSGEDLVRAELCIEAIRLTTLMQKLFPGRAELMSLLALMLLQDSRREARTAPDGSLVLLKDQDRSLWNERQIQQGAALLDKALHLRQAPGTYQLQASIAALHAEATSPDETDWSQISLLYRRLLDLDYTQVLHLNYAVAVSMSGQVETALQELLSLQDVLADYYPFQCALADCHRKLGAHADAVSAYQRALALTGNESEKRFIAGRLAELEALP